LFFTLTHNRLPDIMTEPSSASPTKKRQRNTRPQSPTTTNVLLRHNNRLDNREQNEAAAPMTPETVEQTVKREKREHRNEMQRERRQRNNSNKKTKATNVAAANSSERLPLEPTMQSSSSSSSGQFDRNAPTAAGAEDDECFEAEHMNESSSSSASVQSPAEMAVNYRNRRDALALARNQIHPSPTRAEIRNSQRNQNRAGFVAAKRWDIGDVPKLTGHHTLENEWSYTCPHCSCQHLNSSTASFRKKCCLDGTLLNDDIWTPLEPLIPSLEEMLSTEEGIRHMSSSCTSYNNILSIGGLPDEYILLFYSA
jgi:hypothetical protein